MGREILFRGKRTDNGKMVEGSYCPKKGGHYESDKFVEEIQHLIIVNMNDGGYQYAEVYPETVCQYTGTPDKRRRKIFEGDIVRRKLFEEYIIGEVVWQDIGVCGFYLKCGNKYYPIGKDEYVEMSRCDEVIGNIFDNPELLKGDSK